LPRAVRHSGRSRISRSRRDFKVPRLWLGACFGEACLSNGGRKLVGGTCPPTCWLLPGRAQAGMWGEPLACQHFFFGQPPGCPTGARTASASEVSRLPPRPRKSGDFRYTITTRLRWA